MPPGCDPTNEVRHISVFPYPAVADFVGEPLVDGFAALLVHLDCAAGAGQGLNH